MMKSLLKVLWTISSILFPFACFQVDILRANQRSLISSCYEPNIGTGIGWCGTCVTNAKKGEPGYCGSDQNDKMDEKENSEIATIHSNSTNWGFCELSCQMPKDNNPVLKVLDKNF